MLLRLAIAFISAAVLGYEVLLTRLLSIIQWHHFAYMIISLALLGFGASGTFLTLTQRWWLPRFSQVFAGNAILFGLGIPLSFLAAQQIHFNALEIAWDIRQLFYLAGIYLLLACPFFCAANCIGAALARYKNEIAGIYRFDLTGAGLGALGIIIILFYFHPLTGLRMLAILPFVAAALGAYGNLKNPFYWALLAGLTILCLVTPSSRLSLRPSEYKGLQVTLNVAGTEIIHEDSSPLGILSVVQSPTIPFRYAPGVSLNNTQEPPPQLGVFTDGDAMTVITKYEGNLESVRYLDYTTTALPYYLLNIDAPPHPSPLPPGEREVRTLILGAGGGADVLLAKYHGATHIDAVELNPQMIDLVANWYRDFDGNIYGSEDVSVHAAEARGFVRQSEGWRKSYDLIQVSLLDSFGASSAGLYALNENYLYTVEALRDYLKILKPRGILAITRWLKIPPRDSLKLLATAIEALTSDPRSRPDQQLIMIRSLKTVTLLIAKTAFTAGQIEGMRNFCGQRSFDVAYYPGISAQEVNQYNQLASPIFYEGVLALMSDRKTEFLKRYKFDIAPATDNSPYFFHFLKWKSLPEILSLKPEGGLALLEWGYPILIGALIQSLLASLIFIIWPLVWLKRQIVHQRGFGSVFLYFAALGLAFLFIEMASIQRFILFLSHPLYAIAVILSAFLIFAGLGSGISSHFACRLSVSPSRGRFRASALAVIGIAILVLIYQLFLPRLFDLFLPFSASVRILIAILLIAPLAFLMGMPFPLGLSLLSEHHEVLIPWAWGINGCASVISAILATLLAIHLGFTAVFFLAIALYLLAVVSLYRLS